MKPDTERTKRYTAKLHKKKDFLNVHVSKELSKKLKKKKRALLIHHGDEVKIMRGSSKGKAGHVVKVDYIRSLIYIEGITKRTARGKEVLVPMQPSNLILTDLQKTPEREQLYREAPERKEKIAAGNVVKVDEKPAQGPGPA